MPRDFWHPVYACLYSARYMQNDRVHAVVTSQCARHTKSEISQATRNPNPTTWVSTIPKIGSGPRNGVMVPFLYQITIRCVETSSPRFQFLIVYSASYK